jgi:dihydroorotate dehydrogenase electron transfer subunit
VYKVGMCGDKKSKRGVFAATVVSNEKLCDEHFLLKLSIASADNGSRKFPPSAAGQFVQIQCKSSNVNDTAHLVDVSPEGWPKFSLGELTKNQPLLRRPLSLGGRREIENNTTELQIIYRVVGTGTRWMSSLEPGAELSVLGPLGNPFPIRTDKPKAALVGGGVGIPPMLYTAQALSENGIETVAFCGAQTKTLLPLDIVGQAPDAGGNPTQCVREFTERGAKAVVTTDDGSVGYQGFVTQAFEKWCKDSDIAAGQLVVYSCGPEVMMRVVGDICIKRGIECYLSLERHMGCGMGTCQSCIVKIRDNSEQGWGYKLCCSDGPAFPAELIVWE